MAISPPVVDYGHLVQDDRINSRLYTDPAIFEDELEKVWYKEWIFIGHSSEVPQTGDYRLKKIGFQPVIMTRDEDGGIHLLLNRCIHRGNTVCQDEQGNSSFFRCAYHGWTFTNTGKLAGVTYKDGYDPDFLKQPHSLASVTRTGIYRGFVFGCMSPSGPSLEEHLGRGGRAALDRLSDLSPEGEIDLSAGWLKHRTTANWKMLYEAQIDGYHPGFAHQSILEGRMQDLNRGMGSRDLGDGHTDLDMRPRYRAAGKPLAWLRGLSEDKTQLYMQRMESRYGKERAYEIMVDGPPHTNIWPNLLIAELNIFIVQPMAANKSIQLESPVFIKGMPEIKDKILRFTEGAVGPAGFLLAEDAEMFQRNFRGFAAKEPEWVLLNRGLARQAIDEEGYLAAASADETNFRGFWRHYREVMLRP